MMMKNYSIDIDHLAKFQIFRGLRPEEIAPYADKFNYAEVPANQMIIKEGEPGESIYLLLDGEVEISQALTLMMTKQPELDTREKAITRLNNEMYPFFGEMSIFMDNDIRTANIRTVTKCQLAEIHRKDFFAVNHNRPDTGLLVIENIARVLVERLKKTNNDVIKLTTALALILEK